MLREQLRAILPFSAAILSATTFSYAAALAESFDKPVQQKVVDLGPSPYVAPIQHITLTCSYYANFMVKEVNDPGNKGALLIATVPVQPGHIPGCTRDHQPNEKVFTGERAPTDWDGYFGGMKHNLLFLYASDGTSGGIPFAAFDPKTGMKIFEDSVMLRKGGERYIGFAQTSDSQITLRYLRVVIADCSIPARGAACWTTLKEKADLKNAPIPKCSDYPGAEAGKAESVIGYPVEVTLFPKPSIRALGNPVKCWPSE